MKIFIYTYQPQMGREQHISQEGYKTLKEVQEEIRSKPDIFHEEYGFTFYSTTGTYRIYEIYIKE